MVILSTRADMVCVCASASVCVGRLKHYNKGVGKGVGVGFITWRSGTQLVTHKLVLGEPRTFRLC